jgi:2',3'-cyclic-nucleotide 2'-phosphodiesterase/3'-nucleotidase
MKTGADFSVVILQTSDLHGYMLPIQYANNARTEQGFAKIAAIINEARAADTPIIVIDNGDLIQGTPLAYHHARLHAEARNPMIACLNELRYDAAVIGNHEFNYGLPLLDKAVAESEFPCLTSESPI